MRKDKKPSYAKCALCESRLNAVPKKSVSGMRKLAKTEKRPERVFGGVLCSNCTRLVLREKTRLEAGDISLDEIDLKRMPYVKALKKR